MLDIAVRSVRYDLGYAASDLLGGRVETLLKDCADGGMQDVRYDEMLKALSEAIGALFADSEETWESDTNSSPSP